MYAHQWFQFLHANCAACSLKKSSSSAVYTRVSFRRGGREDSGVSHKERPVEIVRSRGASVQGLCLSSLSATVSERGRLGAPAYRAHALRGLQVTEAMARDEGLETDQDHRQKSGRRELEQTVQSWISATEQEIEELEEEIRAKERQIEAKERQIGEVELAISSGTEGRSALDAKLQFLREEISSLVQQLVNLQQDLQQERTSLLSVQAEGFAHSKRSRIEYGVPSNIQAFAESAAKYYTDWEEAGNAGVENGGHKNFLVVRSDPFGNFPAAGCLVWIRECYLHLKDILTNATESKRFVLLGTEGIGKSLFTLFWICYRATLKEKVVWKLNDEEWYLLDFSKEGSASAKRVEEGDSEVQLVLSDPNAWLIIDWRQPHNLVYQCHILLACSLNKDNYRTFSKNQMVSERYVPVWSKEEINKFLDDFEPLRDNHSKMDVPTKVQANEVFEKLGGVPRYVLCASKHATGLHHAERAVCFLDKGTSLMLCSETFKDPTVRDCLVHIKCRDKSYKTVSMFYDFASPYVQDEFGKHCTKRSKVEVVDFLRIYRHKDAGDFFGYIFYGYIFELVAHDLMLRGGEFRMKRVGSNGVKDILEENSTLTLEAGMKVVEFAQVTELASMSPNTYYKPLSSNFESVDAVVSPNILLQFFSSRRGTHGYKVNELKALHKQLKQTKYKLCSCVFVDKYKGTGFQNWLKADGTKYFIEDPSKVDPPLILMDQYVVLVDYNNFSR